MVNKTSTIQDVSAVWVQGAPQPDDASLCAFSSDRDVHVWRVQLVGDAAAVTEARRLLSSDEEARVVRLATAELQARQVLSFAIVRRLLARYLGEAPNELRFTQTATGKPHLAYEPDRIHFNVSHCQATALYAFALHAPVGVDIERRRSLHDLPGMLTTVLTHAERAVVDSLPPDGQAAIFFDAWTLKEAYLKAVGEGIVGLQSVDAVLGRADAELVLGLRAPARIADWTVGRLGLDDQHAAAVVVAAPCTACRVFTFS